jgi:hypothetical protein
MNEYHKMLNPKLDYLSMSGFLFKMEGENCGEFEKKERITITLN